MILLAIERNFCAFLLCHCNVGSNLFQEKKRFEAVIFDMSCLLGFILVIFASCFYRFLVAILDIVFENNRIFPDDFHYTSTENIYN